MEFSRAHRPIAIHVIPANTTTRPILITSLRDFRKPVPIVTAPPRGAVPLSITPDSQSTAEPMPAGGPHVPTVIPIQMIIPCLLAPPAAIPKQIRTRNTRV